MFAIQNTRFIEATVGFAKKPVYRVPTFIIDTDSRTGLRAVDQPWYHVRENAIARSKGKGRAGAYQYLCWLVQHYIGSSSRSKKLESSARSVRLKQFLHYPSATVVSLSCSASRAKCRPPFIFCSILHLVFRKFSGDCFSPSRLLRRPLPFRFGRHVYLVITADPTREDRQCTASSHVRNQEASCLVESILQPVNVQILSFLIRSARTLRPQHPLIFFRSIPTSW